MAVNWRHQWNVLMLIQAGFHKSWLWIWSGFVQNFFAWETFINKASAVPILKAKLRSHSMCVLLRSDVTPVPGVPVYKPQPSTKNNMNSQYSGDQSVVKNWARRTNSSVGLLERSWPQLVENAHVCECFDMPAFVCVSLDPNVQLSQAERELMWGWHFAGICGALSHFYVWGLGFWYLPSPFSLCSWPGIPIVGPYMCAAAAGQYRTRGFGSQLLSRHKFVVERQF